MSCGFTTRARVSAFCAASTLPITVDAVPLGELVGALASLLTDEQVVDAAAGPDQAGQQGLPHHPGAEDRDLWPSHRATYFLDTSECRKNVRLLGRSARRLIR